MKTSYITFKIAIIGICALYGCKKYEQVPAESITENYAFDSLDKNGTYAEQIVNNIYTYLNPGFNRIDEVVLDAATDDAISSAYGNDIEALSKSRISASLLVDGAWDNSYACIRKVNNFLSKIDQVPRNETDKKFWKAEMRFMRAYSYFELIKRYGGVPLIGAKVYQPEEPITVSRNSFDDCVAYIVNECDNIKDSLRNESVASEFADAFWGRITRGAAMALKARALLYAASALHNPANDVQRWQKAADAAKEVIDLNYYALQPSFVQVFLQRKNKEIILAYQRSLTNDLEKQNAPIGFQAPNASRGLVSPTEELVTAFPMNNGLAITDPLSGYNPDSPFVKRDPRLNWSVFYNGSKWLNRAVETFEGGMDKPGGAVTQTRTGYYMRKFLADFSTASSYSQQTHNFPIFRYAEILLNYAEAANETGNQLAAFDQLKLIRQRAGIAKGTDNGYAYGLKANMNQQEMREAIRLERRIEMAFEEQRYWDIRRWKIAETVGNREVHGTRIVQNNGLPTYQSYTADKIYFDPQKNYLYAIPLKEVISNPKMQQNPGY